MANLDTLSAAQLAAGVAAGDFSATDVARASLEAIDAREPEVQAFLEVSADLALAAAAKTDAARAAGNWTRIAEWFAFLEGNHASSLYMETMKKSTGKWTLGDCGNAEQCIWFVWAIARLRAELGMPASM